MKETVADRQNPENHNDRDYDQNDLEGAAAFLA